MKTEKFDFLSGLKTLIGVIGLSIPYLDGNLQLGKFLFDIPTYLVEFLLTSEMVAFFSALMVYGVGMKVVRFVKLVFPKKK